MTLPLLALTKADSHFSFVNGHHHLLSRSPILLYILFNISLTLYPLISFTLFSHTISSENMLKNQVAKNGVQMKMFSFPLENLVVKMNY